MTEDHVLEYGVADAHEHRDLPIHLRTVFVDADFLAALVLGLQHLFELFELLLRFLVQELEAAHGEDRLGLDCVELQLYACLRLREVANARVVYERLAGIRVRRHLPRRHRAERLDHGRLARAVLPKNHGERLEKLNLFLIEWREAANTSQRHLINGRHSLE